MDDFSSSLVFSFLLDSFEECFYENIAIAPMRLRGAFFVSAEGSNEVAVRVSRVVDFERKLGDDIWSTTGRKKASFRSRRTARGSSCVCFAASRPGKRVTFAMHVGVRKREGARQEHITPLEESMRACLRTLQHLVSEQNFLINCVQSHKVTQDFD